MDRTTVFTKTAKGLMEATGKTSVLSRDMRALLKEVDGKATVGDVQAKLGKVPEAKLMAALQGLASNDFIREFKQAKTGASPQSPAAPPAPAEVDLDLDFTTAIPTLSSLAKKAEDEVRQIAQAAAAEAAARAQAEAAAKAKAEAEAKAKAAAATAAARARAEAEARAKAEAAARARAAADPRGMQGAEQQVRKQSGESEREALELFFEQRERREAEELGGSEAGERARGAAEELARAQEAARLEAEARTRKEAEEAERRAREEAERKAKEAAERARQEAEERARREAEEQARKAAEELARAQEAARVEAEARALKEAEEAERKAREEAERKAKEEAERARQEAEERAQREAEERARKEAEEFARAQAAARLEAEARAREETERRAREEAERKAKEAAERERQEAEERARREAEEQARREAEEFARAQAAARLEAEARAREEAERKAREAAERERQEAEERARREAEERARREAEELARAQEQARIEAEEQARREAEEAERKAKRERREKEAAERERQEAEKRARREAERQARREAEAYARAQEAARKEAEEAERKAKEAAERERGEAEAQARREAEAYAQAQEAARLEAETQARKEAEEAERKAEQAAERERQEAEEKVARESAPQPPVPAESGSSLDDLVRIDTDFDAVLLASAGAAAEASKPSAEADEALQKAAEDEARRLAEEQASREAEARAREEADAAAERAEAERRREDEERQTRASAPDEAHDPAQLRDFVEAQALAQAQEAETERHFAEMEKELEAEGLVASGGENPAESRELARKREEEEARERERAAAAAYALEAEAALAAEAAVEEAPVRERTPVNWGRPTAIALFLILVLGIISIPFIPFDGYIPQFEKLAGAYLQQPVKIKTLHLMLLPQPHWRMDDVSVGNQGQLSAARVNAVAELGSMFSETKVFKSIQLESAVLSEDGLLALLFGKPVGQNFKVARITATNAKLDSKTFSLPALDATIVLGAKDGIWQTIAFETPDHNTKLQFTPDGAGAHVEVQTKAFSMPLNPAFALENFDATGVMLPGELRLSEFNGGIYGGYLSGTADLKWGADWSLKGEIKARAIDPGKLAQKLIEGGSVEGKAVYALQGNSYAALFAAPHLEGSFAVGRGMLFGVELGRFLQGGGVGGKTGFAELTGSFVRDAAKTQLRQIHLASGPLSASGNADIDAGNHINGRFLVEIRSSVAQARANLGLSGALGEPHFSR